MAGGRLLSALKGTICTWFVSFRLEQCTTARGWGNSPLEGGGGGDLQCPLCSRNARPEKGLVRRAQSRTIGGHPLGRKQRASLEGAIRRTGGQACCRCYNQSSVACHSKAPHGAATCSVPTHRRTERRTDCATCKKGPRRFFAMARHQQGSDARSSSHDCP
jgi:hypothetical protein